LGKPEDFALQYYNNGADELIYMDVVASLYGRNNLLKIVERTAKNIFIPLTVGGGVRTLEDIRKLLRAGADKVAINTAAINNPRLIVDATRVFGSQCIVVSIEAKRKKDGKYEAYVNNGREETGVDVFEWAKQVSELGAGEILVTSIDRDGTGKGYDIELIFKIANSVFIPVIACGGAGNKEHIAEVIKEGKADAVSAASIFHYNHLMDVTDYNKYREEGNIEFLKRKNQIKSYLGERITPTNIAEVKSFLNETGVASSRTTELQQQNLVSDIKNYSLLVAIVDYGLGNLFSIERALRHIGADTIITDNPEKIRVADGLILPGVGTFCDGMRGLKEKGLIEPIKLFVATGRPLLGICLGMQLLMTEGEEFGHHQGLDLIKGKVVRLQDPRSEKPYYKVPHIGWNRIYFPKKQIEKLREKIPWKETILEGIREGSYFYFVHSYIVIPDDPLDVTAITEYGDNIFCSVISRKNISGCQFHPERSGKEGLNVYRQFLFGILSQFKCQKRRRSLCVMAR
jgi:cyclase